MRKHFLLILGLALAATPAGAGTFAHAPIAPTLGVDAFTRAVTRARLGKDVFSDPYATVTISNVDLYDRFPYVESRTFQVVSDPHWNRLVCGEAGVSLDAFDGKGTPLGALADPRGLAVDENDRVYVADAGNDRIVVLQAVTEFDQIRLQPLYAIPGLHDPHAVAYSDGGTPFQGGDDVLYVADTGRNQVVAFALGDQGARKVATMGGLGNAVGQFAGPLAVAVGRSHGANTPDVYVADAHNRRIAMLRLEHGQLRWVTSAPAGADVVTSLDTDAWGNVYAAAPQQGVVRKFDPALNPIADLRGSLARPRDFHVPFANVRDHRDGSTQRVGQANGLSVDEWSDADGLQLWSLGAAVEGLGVAGGDAPVAHFVLTDQANVAFEVADAATGRLVAQRALGAMPAGVHDVPLTADDVRGTAVSSDLVLRVAATSSYANGATETAQANFRSQGGGAVVLPTRVALLGNWPNPARPATRISFLLPATHGRVALAIYDASGRRVRTLSGEFAPGLNQAAWDGSDDRGQRVQAGLYFYRLDVGDTHDTRRMVVVR